ncbi:SAVED domain-containing protein [Nesterenkonia sp. Act20]|uniref:SAVED domain-containing protein n=1 Tax=Nesterenkonia sp. Act20 TaxID=1483432 RepID=UPI001C483EDB|nr:SAVED domain-containing protein [Nesterenkonia sp. Act20]
MTTSSSAPDPAGPVFISYRQEDGTDITAELAWLLRAAGIPVWRDRDDLPPGDTEVRLQQAIAAGISAGVLVTTPDVANSRVVKMLEAPHLLQLHRDHEVFALGIANSVRTTNAGTDYDAPDRLLELRPGTLSGVNQQPTHRDGLLALTRGLVWHRIASLRERVQDSDQTFRLSLQTRNTPQVYDRTGDELDIRLRPSDHDRLPSGDGLRDLKDIVGLLPDAVTRSGADCVRVSGGAHLSVAFAVAAALPSSRVGHMVILDQRGDIWASDGEARFIAQPHVQMENEGVNPSASSAGRPSVAIYVDLLPQRSDTAFTRYIEDNRSLLVAWRHLTSSRGAVLNPSDGGLIAADVAARIRELSYENSNAEVHLLLRCPFPLALLIGRLTNTLRVTVYEWDDSDPTGEDDYRARYVPSLRVRAAATAGAIEEVLLP